MGETNGVVDEGFLRRYRVLLDEEAGAFDELEHAYEDGDRAHFEADLAQWQAVLGRRMDFLKEHGLASNRRRTRKAAGTPSPARRRSA